MTTSARPTEPAADVSHETPNRRKLTVNYLLLVAGESFGKICTLVAFVYLGRILGPERYGSLEFAWATMMLFIIPVNLGLGDYGAREFAIHRNDAEDLLRQLSALHMLLASFSFLVLVVLILCLPSHPEVKFLLLFYGLSLFVEPLLVTWFFQGRDEMHWVALANLTRKIAFASFVLLLVRSDQSLGWAGVCELGSVIVMAVVCLSVLRWRFGFAIPRPWYQLSPLKSHFYRSASMSLSHLAWAVLWHFATMFMGWLSDGLELGWFGASHRIIVALHTFVWLYFYNLLPSFTRGVSRADHELSDLASLSLGVTAWGGIFIAIVLTLLGHDLLRVAYDSRYEGGGYSLSILGWLIPITLVNGHYRYLLIASHKQHLDLVSATSAAVSIVLLSFILIPTYGAAGASAALVAANLVYFAFACSFVNFFVFKLTPHRQLIFPIIGAFVSIAVFKSLPDWRPWLSGAAAALTYLFLFAIWANREIRRSTPPLLTSKI